MAIKIKAEKPTYRIYCEECNKSHGGLTLEEAKKNAAWHNGYHNDELDIIRILSSHR